MPDMTADELRAIARELNAYVELHPGKREMHLDTGIPLDGVCEHLTSECRQRCKNERK